MRFDYQDFMIFFTFLLFWLSIQFGEIVEDSLAYGMILSLGIIHGSNDLLILKRQHKKKNQFRKSVVGYLSLIIACIISFLIDPYFSLLLFIIISSYHFGEQHFEDKLTGSSISKLIIYTSYGLIIFSLIFIENLGDVDRIVGDLTGSKFSQDVILWSLMISSLLLLLSLGYEAIRKQLINVNWIKEVFYLTILYLVFKTSSLMMGFAVYFIFWHSIPSIMEQSKYLFGGSNRSNLFSYLKTAGGIWFVSIGGLMAAYYLIEKELFNSIVFILLFAVTAPHVWVMFRMKNEN